MSSAGSFPLPPFLVSPLQDPLSLPWLCCSSLAPDDRGHCPLHQSWYWHIMRIQSLWGKWGQEAPLSLASHHAPPSPGHGRYQSAPWPWLSFSLLNTGPWWKDMVVISLLRGLGCLSPVWTQVQDGRCISCCLVAAFWMACRNPRNWEIPTTSTGGARRPSAS